ncbi:hypothetical protein CEXT_746771 [Caerostris extrusa]|uniref:Uncharacterized protein n=1 Tax=Caerostris extrusa TaxID=172846 RepID=A0AAV4WYU2_CAEEX|nr:hypothetical protein CEXT_746771 [Caerostris extrusa]
MVDERIGQDKFYTGNRSQGSHPPYLQPDGQLATALAFGTIGEHIDTKSPFNKLNTWRIENGISKTEFVCISFLNPTEDDVYLSHEKAPFLFLSRGAVIYDCTGNDAKRKIQPPFQFVGPLGLSSREFVCTTLLTPAQHDIDLSHEKASFVFLSRGAVIYDCTGNDAKRKINHHSNLSSLLVFHPEGWIEILMRQGCSRLTVTARNVHPSLQPCKRHFPETDLASPNDFD